MLAKDSLTETDAMECRKAIYRVLGMESRNDPLPVQATGIRGKGNKRYDLHA